MRLLPLWQTSAVFFIVLWPTPHYGFCTSILNLGCADAFLPFGVPKVASDDEVFGSYYDAKLNTVTVPVDVNVLLGRRAKHKFEGALGVNLGCYHERFKLQGGGIKVEGDQTNFGTFFYTNLGYRFCSKKGLLVRVGMTFNTDFIEGPELFEKRNFAPYFGIGYAF